MSFIAMRTYNGITFYGYAYGTDPRPFWSMRFYAETWHVPMIVID